MQNPSNGGILFGQRPAAIYCHAISAIMLAEVYGMTNANRHERIRLAIMKALDFTRKQQLRPKRNSHDEGGRRYIRTYGLNDADLSITAWQLMFLRAARNAEFNVPQNWVREAMGYVHRSFDVNERGFLYALGTTSGMSIGAWSGRESSAWSWAGEHGSPTAKRRPTGSCGNRSSRTTTPSRQDDRYHYSAFYCSQAMFQLGGESWRRFFPGLLDAFAGAHMPTARGSSESVKDGHVRQRLHHGTRRPGFGDAVSDSTHLPALSPFNKPVQ